MYINFYSGKWKEEAILETDTHRWEDNIKMDLKEFGYESGDWIHVADCWELGNELSGSIKAWEFLDELSDCHLLNRNSAPWSPLG